MMLRFLTPRGVGHRDCLDVQAAAVSASYGVTSIVRIAAEVDEIVIAPTTVPTFTDCYVEGVLGRGRGQNVCEVVHSLATVSGNSVVIVINHVTVHSTRRGKALPTSTTVVLRHVTVAFKVMVLSPKTTVTRL